MKDLERCIREDLLRIGVNIETARLGISFDPKEMSFNSSYSIFVFEDNKGYHFYSLGDRDSGSDSVYQKKSDLLYQVYKHVTYTLAAKYATEYKRENPDSNDDWRKLMFAKQLQLLKIIGPEYHHQRANEINTILQEYP